MSHADDARKANTPWAGRSIHGSRGVPVKDGDSKNQARQRRAFKKLSILEREVGITEAQHDAFHAEQRARMLAKYGGKDAA